jgi:hypothetical protein
MSALAVMLLLVLLGALVEMRRTPLLSFGKTPHASA